MIKRRVDDAIEEDRDDLNALKQMHYEIPPSTAIHPCTQFGRFVDIDRRLDALEKRMDADYPVHDELLTCGTCKHPWRKPDHKNFPCFNHPTVAADSEPLWRLETSDACSNHVPIEGSEKGGAMKCEENGGCPLRMLTDGEHMFECPPSIGGYVVGEEFPNNCHLTPQSFPRLRAELAGEWSCRTCALSGHCEFEKLARFDYFACVAWTPKEKGGAE